MQIDANRLNRQLLAVERWRTVGKGKGTIVACTGFGKTFLAVQTIKRINQKHKSFSVFVIVPGVELAQQWKDQFLNEFPLIQENIKWTVLTVDQLLNSLFVKTDLLILDEIDTYASTERFRLFESINYRWILGLTATFERRDERHKLIEEYAPVCDRIELKEAVANGWVSPFLYIKQEVDAANPIEIISLSEQIKSNLEMIGGFPRMQYIIQNRHEFDGSIINCCMNTIAIIQKRRRVICSDPARIDKAIELFERHKEKRTIIFFEFSNDAETFYRKLVSEFPETKPALFVGEKTYNKKGQETRKTIPKKTRQKLLYDFAANKLNPLICVRALDAGLNIPSIEIGISTAANSVPRQTEQRLGRIIRTHEGKEQAIFYQIFLREYEKAWQQKRQRGVR